MNFASNLLFAAAAPFFCAVLVLANTATVAAQDAPANRSGALVAVLDVAKVFEQNARFNSRLEEIKQEAQRLNTKMESDQEQLRQRARQVSETYKPGSQEFKEMEGQLEQQLATLRTQARQANNDLLNKEAKIYYDTYLEMHQVVSALAEQYNIALVIRFDSANIDPANRADVIKGVHRAVVYQRNLDLTQMVIDQMAAVSTAGVGRSMQ